MNNKTLATVAYITLIGWLISFFSSNSKTPRDPLVKYHLNQAFGLFVLVFCVNIVVTILANVLPASIALILGFVSMAVSVIYLIFMILGAITASKEEMKPLPLIGDMFVNKFDFIK